MRQRSFISICLTLLGAACTTPTGEVIACPDVLMPAISLTVTDSASGAGTGAGATAIARVGADADSTTRPAAGSETAPFLLGGKAGTYSVTVRKVGYATWLRNGIQVVKEGACFVNTVAIVARLQR